MEYVRYCQDSADMYVTIYSAENEKIGFGTLYSVDRDDKKEILYLRNDRCDEAYAHLCHKKEFKCDGQNCNHITCGEIPLMTIETCDSMDFKKENLILLNESFVGIEEYTLDRRMNVSLRKCLAIPYRKQWKTHTTCFSSGIVLHCEICNARFECIMYWLYKRVIPFSP